MYSLNDNAALPALSSLIRISAGHRIFAPHRSFSQLVTSFFGAMYQGILRMLFVAWSFFRAYSCTFYSSPNLAEITAFLHICSIFARLLRWIPWQYVSVFPAAFASHPSQICPPISRSRSFRLSLNKKFYNFNSTNFFLLQLKKPCKIARCLYSY